MTHKSIRLLSIGWLAAALIGAPSVTTAAKLPYTQGHFVLQIDGAPAVEIAKMPLQRDGSLAVPRGGLKIRVPVSMASSPSLMEWIQSSFKKEHMRKSGEIVAADFNYKAQSALEFEDAIITEVKFPTFDANSKEEQYFTITLEAGRIRSVKRNGSPIAGSAGPKTKKWMVTNYRGEIGGLPFDYISKIGEIKFTQKIKHQKVGVRGRPMNIIVVVPNRALKAWPPELRGKSFQKARKELTGSINYLSPDMNTVLMSVPFRIVAGRYVHSARGKTQLELHVAALGLVKPNAAIRRR